MSEEADAYFEKGWGFLEHGQIVDALAAFDAALRWNPALAEAHSGRGFALGMLGRDAEALAAFDEALRLNPELAEAHRGRGIALGNLGRHEEALAAHDEALRLNPALAEAHEGRGFALGNVGRYEESLAACDAALRLNPALAEAHRGRGFALENLGRYEESLAACDAALRLNPALAAAHEGRGFALGKLGRHEESLAAFDEALRLKPALAEAHLGRGYTLENLDRHEESLAAFDEALRLNPALAAAHAGRGFALGNLGRYEESLAACDAALRLNPALVEAHRGRGFALVNLGREQESLDAFRCALLFARSRDIFRFKYEMEKLAAADVSPLLLLNRIAANPRLMTSVQLMGVAATLHERVGPMLELQAACADPESKLSKSLSRRERNRLPGLLWYLGGDDIEAMESFSKALSADPDDALAAFYYVDVAHSLFQTPKGLPLLLEQARRRIEQSGSRPAEYLYYSGLLLYEYGEDSDIDLALQAFKTASESMLAARYLAAFIYDGLGHYTARDAEFAQILEIEKADSAKGFAFASGTWIDSDEFPFMRLLQAQEIFQSLRSFQEWTKGASRQPRVFQVWDTSVHESILQWSIRRQNFWKLNGLADARRRLDAKFVDNLERQVRQLHVGFDTVLSQRESTNVVDSLAAFLSHEKTQSAPENVGTVILLFLLRGRISPKQAYTLLVYYLYGVYSMSDEAERVKLLAKIEDSFLKPVFNAAEPVVAFGLGWMISGALAGIVAAATVSIVKKIGSDLLTNRPRPSYLEFESEHLGLVLDQELELLGFLDKLLSQYVPP